MSWILQTILSSIGRKLTMAITGAFLIIFLIAHVSGNLLLLKGDSGQTFNLYADFMTKNPLIKVIAYTNYIMIILHVLFAYFLTTKNKDSRSVSYLLNSPSANSSWNSRNMGILGTVLFIFLVTHLQNFWYEYKFGNPPFIVYGNVEVRDMYIIVTNAYSNFLYVIFYVISMLFLSLHLWHGFKSFFQTLGLNHSKYTPLIEKLGMVFSITIPSLFAIIPICIYFKV